MNITVVKASFGKTVNLGNYESMRIDVQLESTVPPDSSAVNVFSDLMHLCEDLAESAIEDYLTPGKD